MCRGHLPDPASGFATPLRVTSQWSCAWGGAVTPQLGLLLAGLASLALMWHFHRTHRAAIRQRRGAMLDEASALLGDPRLKQHDVDFPVLEGMYRGRCVRVEALEDQVAFRKIPTLWLLVTVRDDLPHAGVFDFLVRPDNMEYYSPASSLHHSLRPPVGWPQHAWLRTDRPDEMPPLERIAPHMTYFDDRHAKEIVITRRGVRLVYMANQARRSHYLVLRSVQFEKLDISPERVHDLLDRAVAICDDLIRQHSPRPTAGRVTDDA